MSTPAREREQAAHRIVMLARSIVLQVRRPELRQPDRSERIRRATSGDSALPLLDIASAAGAGERDQILAAIVQVLSRPNAQVGAVLEICRALDPETVAAIWWALPEDRRSVIYRDDVCGYTVAHYRDYLPAAQHELDELLAATEPAGDFAADVTRTLARSMLPMGLDA